MSVVVVGVAARAKCGSFRFEGSEARGHATGCNGLGKDMLRINR